MWWLMYFILMGWEILFFFPVFIIVLVYLFKLLRRESVLNQIGGVLFWLSFYLISSILSISFLLNMHPWLLSIIAGALTIIASSLCHPNLLFNYYDLSAINEAEVSEFKKEQFQHINHEVLLGAIKNSRRRIVKFIPHKEALLYDKSGKTIKLLFSEKNRFFHTDKGSFKLSKQNALIVSKLFEGEAGLSPTSLGA